MIFEGCDFEDNPNEIEHFYERNPTSEELAKFFHYTYEHLAPKFGYKTNEVTSVPWIILPWQNKNLMIEVCKCVIERFMNNEI